MFTVRVGTRMQRGGVYALEATVRFVGDPQRGYRVLRWHELVPSGIATAAAD